jgi:hypothetical protein
MREPPRLRDGAGEPLAATLLDAARGYRRPASSRHRILRMLGLPIGFAAAAPAAAGVAASLATKVVLLVSVATVVASAGAVTVAYQRHIRVPAPRQVRAERVSTAHDVRTVASRIRGGAAATAFAPTSQPVLQSGAVVVAAAVEESSPLRRPAPVPARGPLPRLRRAPEGRLAELPSRRTPPLAPEVATVPPVALRSAPPAISLATEPPAAVASVPTGHSLAPSGHRQQVVTSGASVSLPPTPPPVRASLAREISLLDSAERAERRKDYPAALANLDAYERAFPEGALLAEAEVLRISALLASGDEAGGRDRARLFLQRQAPSPLAARVRAMLVGSSHQTKELP